MGVKRKGPWRSLGGCCQELRSVCVRGAELLPCALADKDALGHRLRAMGASFYLSRSPLAALRLRPLGQFRTELLPPPRLAAPSAMADRARRAPSLNRPGARPCLHPVPGLAVIGHSQGAIDALRDAPELARYNPRVTIITVDPPRTSVLFQCVRGVRYLDLHTGEFGLGGGSLSCPQAQNLAMGGLHITLPMRSDAQEQILAYLRQDMPIEMAYAEPTHVSLPPSNPKLSLPPIKPKLPPQAINPKSSKVADETSFDKRFNAVWAGATNVLGPPVISWTEHSYAGVLD